MEIKNIPIAELKPAEYNPRVISKAEMDKLVKDLKEFGLLQPIVVNSDMTIIGGHQRVKAWKQIGHEDIPCIVVNLNKQKEKILNLAFNKVGGDWDANKLGDLIAEVQGYDDALLSGYDQEEIDRILFERNFSDDADDISAEKIREAIALKGGAAIEVAEVAEKTLPRRHKAAFYVTNFEDWKTIRDFFVVENDRRLDAKKLIDLINKNGGVQDKSDQQEPGPQA